MQINAFHPTYKQSLENVAKYSNLAIIWCGNIYTPDFPSNKSPFLRFLPQSKHANSIPFPQPPSELEQL